MNTIINDIDIVIEAILNNDFDDAISMLNDIQEDLKILQVLDLQGVNKQN